MTASVDLPESLVSILKARSELRYDATEAEPGMVWLLALGRHRLGEMSNYPTAHPAASEEPHFGVVGYDAVPAVNLVAECEEYDPEYILFRLPDRRQFGTWDSDHLEAYVFQGTVRGDLVADPIGYLNARWEPDGVPTQLLTPWPDYPFRPGSPY